jgi:protein-S-isoprenylcysteine O-methyltransferase Ste14
MQLKRNGVELSPQKPILVRITSGTFLLLFAIILTAELIYQASLISFSFLPYSLNQPLIQLPFLSVFGVIIIIMAIFLINFTLLAFNKSLRFGLHKNNLGKLVTTGVFGYSRNPFFASILSLFLGIALVFPSPFFVAIIVLSFISIHAFILKEEKFMRKHYGEEYEKYCQRVRRYL